MKYARQWLLVAALALPVPGCWVGDDPAMIAGGLVMARPLVCGAYSPFPAR